MMMMIIYKERKKKEEEASTDADINKIRKRKFYSTNVEKLKHIHRRASLVHTWTILDRLLLTLFKQIPYPVMINSIHHVNLFFFSLFLSISINQRIINEGNDYICKYSHHNTLL